MERFKHNYVRKILSNQLSRIIRYHRGLQRRQVNYTDSISSLYTHFKKGAILKGENFNANYRRNVRYNGYVKETDLNEKFVYITENDSTRISFNYEKYVMFIKRDSKFNVRSVGFMNIYVSNSYHRNRDNNFLRNTHHTSLH